ncbi:hypothetical protein BXO88_05760 [Oribacterium sp. C9]|uniref:hypothetical protein n=1 Tax=Oribacterium sp. C9 TaxID=1943579 RepID=UPI00098F89DA|nr:hypothetical protein [Oribacterium sp. C9]OON87043.1 hypothetical protein BXO88_05760 [Oribacterium sp. C9]
MKRMNKYLVKASIFFGMILTVSVMVSGIIFAAEAGKTHSFDINSMEDYKNFAKQCRSNVWSDGMTVSLNTDLDFSSEKTFPAVSYFNGTFKGNNHKITNVRSEDPMFRTIGSEGSVFALELTSVNTSERDRTAAFVSENYGTVEGVTVNSTVNGKTTAGILAAVNGETGIIRACHVTGTLEGDNGTGGIAGRNAGLIEDCTSAARVNTSVRDSGVSTEDIKDILENILITRSINNVENFKTRIDTGGIAGYNLKSGTIRNCETSGITGYSHLGYNTGGIAGRNGGAIEDSVNKGAVFGRKDTGGIAGQQQPEITLDFSKDVLASISDEIDSINLLVTDTLNTTEGITNSTYARLNGISKTLTEVKNSTNTIYNASLDRFDELSESINTNSQTILDATGDIGGDMDYLDDSFDSLSSMSDSLNASIDDIAYAFSLSEDDKNALIARNNQLREDLSYSSNFINEAKNNLLPETPEERKARISDGVAHVNQMMGDVQAIRTYLDGLRQQRDLIVSGAVQTDLSRRETALKSSVSNLLNSLNSIDDASYGLSRFSSSVGGTLSGLPGRVNIHMDSNPVVRAAGNNLYAQLDSLSSQLDSLSAFGRDDSIEVLDNLSAINSRFNSITDLLRNERERLNGKLDEKDLFKDTSNNENSTSRIYRCRNSGNISGDIGVGGIVGTIGIEFDLDPDKDIRRSNDRSLDYSFGVSAVVIESENQASVEGRGNYAGGICGKMETGYITDSKNTGDVEAQDGHFVGGIAGFADGKLNKNTARCRITGKKNVGGISGYGTTLTDNSAAVTILGEEEYAGAVSGQVEKLDASELKGNVYFGGNYGAIDNIDYAGLAEESSVPIGTLLVQFRMGGMLLDMQEAKPGTVLKDVPFPEPEEKEGFFIQWDAPMDTVIEDDLVVNASYYLPVALLNAPENYKDSNKPVIMVDGQFMEEDVLGFSMPEENHYLVEIPEDALTERKIRVHKPEWSRYSLSVNGHEQATEDFGDYLVFVTGERTLDILITKQELPAGKIAAAIAGLVFLILLIVYVNRGGKKKEKKRT